MEVSRFNIALAGNPNSGKSSLFNQLTGLNRKTGNFPGVTVDKKTGSFNLSSSTQCSITDLPGTYSLHPNSLEEAVTLNFILEVNQEKYPDAIIYVTDIRELEKQLLLFSQLQDVGIPLVLVLNMIDLANPDELVVDIAQLERKLQIKICAISSRDGTGIQKLKQTLKQLLHSEEENNTSKLSYELDETEIKISNQVKEMINHPSAYLRLLATQHAQYLLNVSPKDKGILDEIILKNNYKPLHSRVRETMSRFDKITPLVQDVVKRANDVTSKSFLIDGILTHTFIGPIIFMSLMFLLFQAIFSWATIPMDWIEIGINHLSSFMRGILPVGYFADLMIDGVISGLGGIIIFIPQIAFMFLFVSLLEESGYMARVVFMFDRLMRSFGLNGRSLISLISSNACAIPAIMSTRTIRNRKERLITIFVAPLMSCSARIPVYAILIGFIVPNKTVFGIVNLQGLAFSGLFLLGVVFALLVAFILKFVMKSGSEGFLMISLPQYQIPYWKNVLSEVYSKVAAFVFGAGKIIIIISIFLWFLSTFGPNDTIQQAESSARIEAGERQIETEKIESFVNAKKLEASYAGRFGKLIEPAIRPLGYDWKIGIALLSSFAAREVFIGSLATIYSIESEDDTLQIKSKMQQEVNPNTGEKVFTMATVLSLLIFYVIAMQCMSTMAIVKRETNSWRMPITQFVVFGTMAYVSAFVVYQVFS